MINGSLHLPEWLGEVRSQPWSHYAGLGKVLSVKRNQLLDALNDTILTSQHARYLENMSTEVWGGGRWGGGTESK